MNNYHKNEDNGYVWEEGRKWEQYSGDFQGTGNILFLNLSSSCIDKYFVYFNYYLNCIHALYTPLNVPHFTVEKVVLKSQSCFHIFTSIQINTKTRNTGSDIRLLAFAS